MQERRRQEQKRQEQKRQQRERRKAFHWSDQPENFLYKKASVHPSSKGLHREGIYIYRVAAALVLFRGPSSPAQTDHSSVRTRQHRFERRRPTSSHRTPHYSIDNNLSGQANSPTHPVAFEMGLACGIRAKAVRRGPPDKGKKKKKEKKKNETRKIEAVFAFLGQRLQSRKLHAKAPNAVTPRLRLFHPPPYQHHLRSHNFYVTDTV
jgi:hypothetical protein